MFIIILSIFRPDWICWSRALNNIFCIATFFSYSNGSSLSSDLENVELNDEDPVLKVSSLPETCWYKCSRDILNYFLIYLVMQYINNIIKHDLSKTYVA